MKVALIGDSIRGGYQPLVKQKLAGTAEVWGPEENCCYSQWTLANFERWVAPEQPDILHFNFGIHDSHLMPDGHRKIVLEQYRLCLGRVIALARNLESRPRLIWATTTPVFVPRKDIPMTDWERDAERVDPYNEAALEIVNAEGIPVNDLHAVILENDYVECMRMDGCHMEPAGNERLSDAVVAAIRKVL